MNIKHLDTTSFLGGFIALVCLGWGLDLVTTGGASGGSTPWNLRHDALYLSGLLSIGLMSLAMLLASRPAWLEGPLGGLDRIYRAHKWAGILAASFAGLHWFIDEVVSGILKGLYGQAGKVPKLHDGSLQELLRSPAKDMAEWAIYALLAMVVIALVKQFPYKPWRLLHKAMPILYLMLAFHALVLIPKGYWLQPIGLFMALLLALGIYGSVIALSGRIGRSLQVKGRLEKIEQSAPDVLRLDCQLDGRWPGHQPGQFALLTLDLDEKLGEGHHPFTIASAAIASAGGDQRISFQIKALGDYTRGLAKRLRPGQEIQIEGPYGRFQLGRQDPKARQIWIAGGIGITPFLAWLESLVQHPEQAPQATLYYCTRDAATDPFAPRLEALCAKVPGIELKIQCSGRGQRLDAQALLDNQDRQQKTEVWFCGPKGLATALKSGLEAVLGKRLAFHQEVFELR